MEHHELKDLGQQLLDVDPALDEVSEADDALSERMQQGEG